MEDPLGQTPEKSYLGVFHLKWHIKCFYFYFLGGVLRVIHSSDIFENLRPPTLGFKNSQIEIGNYLGVFSTPPH